MEKNKKLNFYEKLVIVAVFLLNLTQLPFIVEKKLNSIFSIIIILIVVVFLLPKFNKFKVNKISVLFIIGIIAFDLFILTCALFNIDYITSPLVYSLNLSIFILILFTFVCQIIDFDKIKNILILSYGISTFITMLVVYYEFFKGNDILGSAGYLYGSKNSISFNIVIACIITLFLNGKKSYSLYKILYIIVAVPIMFIIKSRASILSLLVGIIVYIFLSQKHRKFKFFILMCAILLIFAVPKLNQIIIQNILFNNKVDDGLNGISSGRMEYIYYFFNNFKNVLLFGNGGWYIDVFPLLSLYSYGIIGSVIVFSITILPFFCVKFNNSNSKIFLVLYLASLANALFEGLAPFGPGVKFYFVWIILAAIITKKEKKDSIDSKEKLNER